MSVWPTVKLSTLATFRNGLNFAADARGKGLPIVGVRDFQDRSFVRYGDLEELKPEALSSSDSLIAKNDIIFVRSNGNREFIGRSLFVAEAPPKPTSHSGFTIRLRFIDQRALPRFFAYQLRGEMVRKLLSSKGGGTNINNLNQGILGDLDVALPPLWEQERIAQILGAYDDLIDVNRRRVALLEDMARGLFEEWFVRFRYPGCELVLPGDIPAGWREVPIKEAYEGLYDGPHATPPSAASGAIFLGIGNITETGRLDLSSVRSIADEDFDRWTKRVMPREGDLVFTYEATLNRYALIPKNFRGCLGRRLALIRANSAIGMNRYLYLYFFTETWRNVIAKNTLSGATVDRVPLSRFPEFPIRLPPDALLAHFDGIVRPMFDEINVLEQMSVRLAASRDLLLPRLISGQLSFAEAERELARAA